MAEQVDFDLIAASLRADASDTASSVEALALKLEDALPSQVRVERHGGLLGGKKQVEQITVELGDERFDLSRGRGGITCQRRSVVRGIVLKSEQLSLPEWTHTLAQALAEEANRSEESREALARMLGV